MIGKFREHRYHYEDEQLPDGTTVRHAVLDEPERFRREMEESICICGVNDFFGRADHGQEHAIWCFGRGVEVRS